MPEPSSPVIVLTGMMGAGKSSVGRSLSKRTGWPYLDNDQLVQAATGRAPQAIDAEKGEAALHDAEVAALRYALGLTEPRIVGAAAYVVVHPASVALLREQPAVVYVRARASTLRTRIGGGTGRRDDATDLDWIAARLAERDGIYRELAALTIDTEGLTPGAVAARIAAEILG